MAAHPEDPINQALTAMGIDYTYAGSDMGGTPLCVRGPRKIHFQVRRLLLEHEVDERWGLGWPADSMVLMESWGQIGWDKGPWTRIAEVRHPVTSTERILDFLGGAGVVTYFSFGRTTDWVFARRQHSRKATDLLREARFLGVDVHTP